MGRARSFLLQFSFGPLFACAAIVSATAALPASAQLAPAPVVRERYDGHKLVRVRLSTLRDVRTMLALSNDPWTCGWDGVSPGEIDFRVTPEAFALLEQSGLGFTVRNNNLQASVDAEQQTNVLRDISWFSDYKDFAACNTYLDGLVTLRPDLASRVALPNLTAEGRAIPCIRIAGPGVSAGSKPGIVIMGCQHAREWITVMTTMFLADNLVTTYSTSAQTKAVLDNFEVFVIPVANPDGYVYSWTTDRFWRKDRGINPDSSVGTDTNRNWGYQWGGAGASSFPSDITYRGTAPFSSLNTQAISNFIIARPNIVHFMDVHSFSQLILEPWGFDWAVPPDTKAFGQLSAAMQNATSSALGTPYLAGPTLRTIYAVSGGSQDWAYGVRNILALGMELRDTGASGFTLPAAQIIPNATEYLAGFNAAANWLLANPLSISFPDDLPSTLTTGGPTNVLVQINRGLRAIGDFSATPPTVSVRIGRTAPFVTTALSSAGSDESGPVFQHTLTPGPCGSVVQWYYTATTSDGSTITIPSGGATAPYEALARTSTTIFSDNFETALPGWTIGDTGDTTPTPPSAWVRGDPNGTQDQQEFDHTPLSGVNCFFTGQNARSDTFGVGRVGETINGTNQAQKVTLRSPIWDLSASPNAEISFWLSFANSRQYGPDDAFRVDITANAGLASPTWVPAITIAPTAPVAETTARWRKYTIRPSALITPSASVRLRFVAQEDGNGDAVEAAIDDVLVTSSSCVKAVCRGDFSADGARNVQDIFDFLAAWFGNRPSADFNASGVRDVQDIFDFLAAWFAGCP